MAAQFAQQVHLGIEVDGPNLQFDTAEALLQLLLHALVHLLVAAHPHQSVDGDTLLTPTEGGVEQAVRSMRRALRTLQIE